MELGRNRRDFSYDTASMASLERKFLQSSGEIIGTVAIALVALSFPISLRRMKVGDMIGDSADDLPGRRIRAQRNFAEYVPLDVVMLGIVEAQPAPGGVVFAGGTMLAFGRGLHVIGMLSASEPVRGFGMIFTYSALLASAG